MNNVSDINEMRLQRNLTERTERLMNLIAVRLSGRDFCKGMTYHLHISNEQHIMFEPDIEVYPDRYHRKDTDKSNVLNLILIKKYSEFIHVNENGGLEIHPNTFIPGEYEYTVSFNKKRRKWIRVK